MNTQTQEVLELAVEYQIDLDFYDHEVDVIWWSNKQNRRPRHTEYYKNHPTKLEAVEVAIKKAVELIEVENANK